MLKILQAGLQQYVNCELPDVEAGFRKGRGTRDPTEMRQNCLNGSRGGVGQQWTTAGAGALGAADLGMA